MCQAHCLACSKCLIHCIYVVIVMGEKVPQFPMGTITNYHKLDELKQRKFIPSQF